MRLGEILALPWGDIDWQTRMVSVQRSLVEVPRQPTIIKSYPKTSKGFRTLRLTTGLFTLMEAARAATDMQDGDVLVFRRADGRPLAERAVETFFEKVRNQEGLPPVLVSLAPTHFCEIGAPGRRGHRGHLKDAWAQELCLHRAGLRPRSRRYPAGGI